MFRKEIFNSLGRLMHDEAFLISTEQCIWNSHKKRSSGRKKKHRKKEANQLKWSEGTPSLSKRQSINFSKLFFFFVNFSNCYTSKFKVSVSDGIYNIPMMPPGLCRMLSIFILTSRSWWRSLATLWRRCARQESARGRRYRCVHC